MQKKRIGLIVPSSNTMMESDYIPRLPNDRATLHIARMHIKNTTRKEEERMVSEFFPQAMADLASAESDLILFGCTSAGTLTGPGNEGTLESLILEKTGIHGLTVTRSITTLMRNAGVNRIVLFTPYVEELNQSILAWLASEGFDVVLSRGMGIVRNRDIASVPVSQIVEFSMSAMTESKLLVPDGESYVLSGADAILYSCTNFPAWDCLPEMQKRVKTNYFTSNQALFDYALQLLGLND